MESVPLNFWKYFQGNTCARVSFSKKRTGSRNAALLKKKNLQRCFDLIFQNFQYDLPYLCRTTAFMISVNEVNIFKEFSLLVLNEPLLSDETATMQSRLLNDRFWNFIVVCYVFRCQYMEVQINLIGVWGIEINECLKISWLLSKVVNKICSWE